MGHQFRSLQVMLSKLKVSPTPDKSKISLKSTGLVEIKPSSTYAVNLKLQLKDFRTAKFGH